LDLKGFVREAIGVADNNIKSKYLNLIHKDIDIQITGLRPGEKLYEEVLASSENTLSTHHPKILIAKTRQTTEVHDALIQELLHKAEQQENELCVTLMKKIVPEFISNNSTYQKLDQ
jgi:FlaA1/EpsC-like NDP-sugar epimerase